MKRSRKKGPFLIVKKTNIKLEKKIIIFERNFEITSTMVGLTCQVHNGKKYIKLNVSEVMVGHKFGEFVPTRVKFIFVKKKKKRKKK